MQQNTDLAETLKRIDGRGYATYRQLRGLYDYGLFQLSIDHVQVDPFAPPSKIRVIVAYERAALPSHLRTSATQRVATSDFLARQWSAALAQLAHDGDTGISIGTPGQEVVARTSVAFTPAGLEARLTVGLPARGRRVLGHAAARLFTELIPRLVERCLLHRTLNTRALEQHVSLYEQQECVRKLLAARSLVAFIADGAILPRAAGNSGLPLSQGVVPFSSPDSLRVTFELPGGDEVTGMGVPEGVTVIIGGGYHGKSTLLRALARGVYAHVAGDGREWVITRADAVSVRAEDGRAVTGLDISPFISNLPSGADTHFFSTTNASGSTSQAANMMEALEAGASALFIDEDTSATNIMIRDERMRALIPAEREPITPLVERVRALYTERGVSTVLVAGGSGAFFDVADRVIAMEDYRARDLTEKARSLVGGLSGPSQTSLRSGGGPVFPAVNRVLASDGLRREHGRAPRGRGREIQYGKETIDLGAVAQLVDPAQAETIARALDVVASRCDGRRTLHELVTELFIQVQTQGLEILGPASGHPGQMALPRVYEIHAAVNRYRGLRVAYSS